MRLNRFYSSIPLGEEVVLQNAGDSSDVFKQIHNVFRAKIGFSCIFFDGLNPIDHVYELKDISKNQMSFKRTNSLSKNKCLDKNNVLCLSLIKKDGFEDVVQKAVEVGIGTIIPILSERSEKKLLNEERLRKIIIEAVEQSGRNDIPTLANVQNIKDVIELTGQHFVFHTEDTASTTKDIDNITKYAWVGPEGGWSESEIELFKKHGPKFVSLPTYTLRATTAGVLASFYIVNL